MFRSFVIACVTVSTIAGFGQASASREDATATVNEIVRLLERSYVFPKRTGEIAGRLRKSLASGEYDGKTPQALAAALTQDLQAVTADKHMNVKYNPDQAAALRAPGAGGPQNGDGFFAKLMATSNYGIPELKVMAGNVRYIDLSPALLWDPQRSPKAFDAAMDFLRGGDAYIIDLRKNGGGSPAAVRYVVSHFMEPGQKLMTYHMGPDGTSESVTEPVKAGRLPAKPLFVLTSGGSASAAEELAAHIRNFTLGTLVGAKTAGAGNRNTLYGTPAGFVVSISVGTAIHPVTNAGWEGTGVAPHIEVPAAEALDVAHREAVKAIGQKR